MSVKTCPGCGKPVFSPGAHGFECDAVLLGDRMLEDMILFSAEEMVEVLGFPQEITVSWRFYCWLSAAIMGLLRDKPDTIAVWGTVFRPGPRFGFVPRSVEVDAGAVGRF